jgi:hypothetical protein
MKRIIIDVSDAEANRIDELLKICGLKSRTSLVKSSLESFEWLVEQRRLGKKIFAQKAGDEIITELESSVLRRASLNKKEDIS